MIVAGIIHLLALSGIAGSEKLSALYGLDLGEPNIEVLMRHRAILFGLLGGFIILAAFDEKLRLYGIAAGLVSVISFLLIVKAAGGVNEQIQRVYLVDILALVSLLIAAALQLAKANQA